MCDYSLHNVASRPARVGDKLVSTSFLNACTRGFAATGKPNVAVCLLPGTELAFEENLKCESAHGFGYKRLPHKVARFTQVNKEQRNVHHDALELPDGEIVLVTKLAGGQHATVLVPSARRLRHSFTPDVLARFSRLFDEVWKELLEEGVLDATHDPRFARRRLAKTLFRFAPSPWTDIQMKQLLMRAFRNEAARLQRAGLQSRLLTEPQARAVAGTYASLPPHLLK